MIRLLKWTGLAFVGVIASTLLYALAWMLTFQPSCDDFPQRRRPVAMY